MTEPIVPAVRSQRNFVVSAFLAVVLAVLALVPAAQAKPLSQADREFVDATVAASMAETHQPGASISITGPKGNYTRTYGTGNLATGAPLELDDHFRIGSITKTFTATAILRQVEKGRLRLSDTLEMWIKGIPNGDRITVREMLAMRSGVYEYEADPAVAKAFAANLLMPFSPQDVLRIIRKHEPEFAPGTKTQYANSNYVLLGLILERVTGESAEAAISKEVIKPLGLRHTSFATNPRMPAPFPQGYNLGEDENDPLVNTTAFNPDFYWTAGAIISTLGDMRKYSRQLGTGALLSPEMQAKRLKFGFAPYAFDGPKVFGYGLGIIGFGRWVGHNGSVPGYSSEAFYDTRSGAVIAGLENMQTPTLAIFSYVFKRIAAHLYPGSLKTPNRPE